MFDIDTVGSTLLKLGVGVAAAAGLFLLIDTWLDDEKESCGDDDENEEADLETVKAAKAAKAALVDDEDNEEEEEDEEEEEEDEEAGAASPLLFR